MEAGRVLQGGIPRERYARPRTRVVADVIAPHTLLDGRVRAADDSGGRVTVETAIGRLEGFSVAPLRPGDPCTVSVRPEAAQVGPAEPSWGNRLRGKIGLAAYLGSALRYDVETGAGVVFKVAITDPGQHRELDVGTEVFVGFPPAATLVLPA
jgi:ABC-type Fe3+/spermidine/putrescine transport system ATPase subunit